MHVRAWGRGDLPDAPQADRRLGPCALQAANSSGTAILHHPGRHGRRDRRADSLDSANDSVEPGPGW